METATYSSIDKYLLRINGNNREILIKNFFSKEWAIAENTLV